MSIEQSRNDGIEIPQLKSLSFSSMDKIQDFILKNNLIPTIIIILLVALGAAGYFLYNSQKNPQAIKTTIQGQQILNQDEVKRLVAEVGKIIKLPRGEEPSVATVTDVNKLKDQAFFADGKNGDHVLLYPNAKKVILYDPQSKKIVNIAPLTATGSANVSSASATPTQAKIGLLNGTPTAGLASRIEAEIRKSFPQAEIVVKDNAVKTNYDKTIVIMLNPAAKDASVNLAAALKAPMGDFPVGENKPVGVDLVVIIGKDKI